MSSIHFETDLELSNSIAEYVGGWLDQLAKSVDGIPPVPTPEETEQRIKRLAREDRKVERKKLAREQRRLKKLQRGLPPPNDHRLSLSRRVVGKRIDWTRCAGGSMFSFFQQHHDVDEIAYAGYIQRLVTIEEKVRRGTKYVSDLAFEVLSNSNRGKETPGWGVYSSAEWLLYIYIDKPNNELVCKLLDMQRLKSWAWKKIRKAGGIENIESVLGWKEVLVRDQSNHTLSYAIPYSEMPSGLMLKEFTLSTKGRRQRKKRTARRG